jgi:hypothetical protein
LHARFPSPCGDCELLPVWSYANLLDLAHGELEVLHLSGLSVEQIQGRSIPSLEVLAARYKQRLSEPAYATTK